jgi:transposase-like protein
MAAPGAPRDRGKELFWRRLLQLWPRSGRTIRDFCADHHVTEASFFAWRRTIAERDRELAGKPATASAPPAFVPLRVVATPPPESVDCFEVVLGDDCVVRVPAGFNPASFRQLLAILQEQRPC